MDKMINASLKLLPPAVEPREACSLLSEAVAVSFELGLLNHEFDLSPVGKGLLHLMALDEAVSSRRLEGSNVSMRDCLQPAVQGMRSKREVREVNNYLTALQQGEGLINSGMTFNSRFASTVHAVLHPGSDEGEFRRMLAPAAESGLDQAGECAAVPASEISAYLANLEYFVNGLSHSTFTQHPKELYVLDERCTALIKLGIMHAQFANIKPFAHDNALTARLLLPLIARLLGLSKVPLFFVSTAFFNQRLNYQQALKGVCRAEPEWYEWLLFFLECCSDALKRMRRKILKANLIYQAGLDFALTPSELKVWQALFTEPMLMAPQAARLTELSAVTARAALTSLADRRLITAPSGVQRNRVYIFEDLLTTLESLL